LLFSSHFVRGEREREITIHYDAHSYYLHPNSKGR
jgi:hypothetical protein